MGNGGPAILGLSPNESTGESSKEESGQSGSTTATAGTKAKKSKADKKSFGGGGKGQQMNPGQGVPVQPRKEKNP